MCLKLMHLNEFYFETSFKTSFSANERERNVCQTSNQKKV